MMGRMPKERIFFKKNNADIPSNSDKVMFGTISPRIEDEIEEDMFYF